MIFESHAHYDDEQFNEDRDSLLKELPLQNNIRRYTPLWVCIPVMPVN